MSRQPRMDTPGALHHVIGRGIDRTNIFRLRISGDSIQQFASVIGFRARLQTGATTTSTESSAPRDYLNLHLFDWLENRFFNTPWS